MGIAINAIISRRTRRSETSQMTSLGRLPERGERSISSVQILLHRRGRRIRMLCRVILLRVSEVRILRRMTDGRGHADLLIRVEVMRWDCMLLLAVG